MESIDWKCVEVAPPTGPAPTAFKGKKYEPHTLNKGTDMEMTLQMETHEYAEHLRALFQRLALKNWKGRINVKIYLTEGEAHDMSNAVGFICGGGCEFWEIDPPKRAKVPAGTKRWQITAPGYYNRVGA
jgi:hypothetical protein